MASRHHFDRRRQCYVDEDDDDDNDAVYNKHQAYGRQRQRDDNSDGEYDSDSQRYKSVANDIPRTRVGQAYHGRQSHYQTYHDNDSETDNPQVNYHHTSYRHPRDEEDSDSEEDYGNPRAVAHHRNTPPIPGRINMFPDDRQRRSAGRNSPDGYRSLSPQYYPQNISSDGTFMSANSREPNDEPQSLNAWPWDAPDTNVNARGARSSRQQAGRFSHPHPSMTGYNRHRGGRQQRYAEDQQPQQPRRRIQQPTTYSARGRRRSHPMQQRQRQNPRDFREYDTPDEDNSYSLEFERDNWQSQWHGRRQNITTTQHFDQEEEDVNSESLAEILVQKPALRASLLHLLETYQLEVSTVRKLVLANPNIFRIAGEVVELRMNVKICSAHNGDKGCVNRSECKDLHICSKYARNQCQKEDCIMGHSWLTNHNIRILDSFKIHNLSRRSKEKVLQASLTTRTNTSSSPLNVCHSYNQGTCRRRDCYNLHICFKFVTGHCSGPQCQLNHDLLAPDCSRMLQDSGIDVNESPRDVLLALLEANPSIKKKKPEVDIKSPSLQNLEITQQKSKNVSSETQNSTPTNKSPRKNKPKKNRTVWTHFARGDVDIVEICYESVESVCNNESNGCKRLHAIDHYHWQLSEDGSSWFNLQQHQIMSIEQDFCDVNNDNSKLPRFDPSRHQNSSNFLLGLLGRDSWLADFKTMKITNSKNTKSLQIRRLCTEIVPGTKVLPSSFIWYFLDQQQNWVEYGKVDTLGKTDLVSSLTTHDIEKQFLQDSSSSLTFSNSQFSYTLDFKTMTQTNQNTHVAREIRRRPEVHLEDENEKQDGKHRKPPSEWEKMQPNERLRRVIISSTSDEYKKVVQLLGNQISSNNVTKLERIQNLFHWYAFQNKIEEMTSIYGDVSKVKVQQLFHGTGHDIVPKICSENFDPRLHGLSAGQAYGQGTYFARDAQLSYRYCKADSNGLKYLFVAQVAVGSLTLGNSSMARPPINSSTGAPFDSTVDNAANPSIIVKYDKAEYYPQYIFTLK